MQFLASLDLVQYAGIKKNCVKFNLPHVMNIHLYLTISMYLQYNFLFTFMRSLCKTCQEINCNQLSGCIQSVDLLFAFNYYIYLYTCILVNYYTCNPTTHPLST